MDLVEVTGMTPGQDKRVGGEAASKDDAVRIEDLYCAKASEEVRLSDLLAPGSDAVPSKGAFVADVAVVKGLPGPAEASGGSAFSGADGEAIAKGLEALGHDASRVFFVVSRPEPGISESDRAARLRGILEAVDAELVIACDAEAAADVAAAFGFEPPSPGKAVREQGRRFVILSGFEASLADRKAKERVWRQMQAAAPRPDVF